MGQQIKFLNMEALHKHSSMRGYYYLNMAVLHT